MKHQLAAGALISGREAGESDMSKRAVGLYSRCSDETVCHDRRR